MHPQSHFISFYLTLTAVYAAVESIILQEIEQNASNARLLGQLPPCNPLVAIEVVTVVDETTAAAVVVMTSTLEAEMDTLVVAVTVAATMRAEAGEVPIDAIEMIMVATPAVVVTMTTVVANVENEETDLIKHKQDEIKGLSCAHANYRSTRYFLG
jgi:hypothetical protein